MTGTTLFLALIFGCVGMGYFVYGKKQARWTALGSGLGLCLIPYFVANIYILLLVGVILIVLPFVIKN